MEWASGARRQSRGRPVVVPLRPRNHWYSPSVCMVIFRGILASLGFTRRFEELPERMLHCKLGACLSTMRSRASPPSLGYYTTEFTVTNSD